MVAAALPPAATLSGMVAQPPAVPARTAASTQLADQFRESVQAGGAVEDLPQEGWFVGVNGVPLGPIPLGDLRELAMAGHIDRRSLVWRDGNSEWRPLGKFPGLARVIDDGSSSAPRADAPAAPRPNGANGHIAGGQATLEHVATGFDAPRADAGERPSAWGDLDDDDEEDEQPTTVKGRVSMMPAGAAPPSVTSLPAPSSPTGLPPPAAPNPFGMTSSVLPPLAPAPVPPRPPAPVLSMPPTAMESAAPVSIISAMPDSMDDPEDGLRPPRRSKWALIAVAIVFAFVLGAIVTHLMRSSSTEKTSSVGSSSSEPSSSMKPYGDVDTGSEGSRRKAAEEAREPAITAALRPGDVEPGELTTARAALSPAPTAAPSADREAVSREAVSRAAKVSATGSLLAGLGSPRAPGPASAREERGTGSGLDATAIQRTVRRYSPGVRQNCWLRALDARPPGVPTSVKLTATITVDASGHVQGVAVTGAPRGYPSLSRCVEGAVKSWQFPRSGAQTITNVPFMFVGQ
jgi:hypothetical protein